VVWVGAVAFRLIVLVSTPSLSDDVYRYLWDGRVLLSGINPYQYSPVAPELEALRDAHWLEINNPALPTIYPPFLMFVFAAVGWISHTVTAWKAACIGFDLAAGFCLMAALVAHGRSRLWALVYLWHPLVIVEFAGSGHADAVGIFLVSLAFWGWARMRWLTAGTALTLAGLVKFLPWAAVFVLLRRLKWKWILFPAMVALFYLPFQLGEADALGSLRVFAAKWRSNDFLFSFLLQESEPGEAGLLWAKRTGAVLVGVVWFWVMLRRRPLPSVYAWSLGTALLVSPVVHPWYVIWLLPAVLFASHPAWWLWSITVFLAYEPLPGFLTEGVWEESPVVKALEYVPVLLFIPLQILLEKRSGTRG
jgi:hypothetical protein